MSTSHAPSAMLVAGAIDEAIGKALPTHSSGERIVMSSGFPEVAPPRPSWLTHDSPIQSSGKPIATAVTAATRARREWRSSDSAGRTRSPTAATRSIAAVIQGGTETAPKQPHCLNPATARCMEYTANNVKRMPAAGRRYLGPIPTTSPQPNSSSITIKIEAAYQGNVPPVAPVRLAAAG